MRPDVVPTRVKVRIGFIVLIALTAWFGLPAALTFSPGLTKLFRIGYLVFGLYVTWCLWPRVTWGIPANLVGGLAQPKTQVFRLTFDDGPTAQFTERLLDLLAKHRVKASFFVLVHKARANSLLIRRIVREGHELGLHGEDHRFPFFRSPAQIAQSLGTAKAELEAIAGVRVPLYRPSHGYKNLALVEAVRRSDLAFCFWDFGVWDTDAPSIETLETRLLRVFEYARAATREKPVILLHDGKGDEVALPSHADTMLAALDAALAKVMARGDAPV